MSELAIKHDNFSEVSGLEPCIAQVGWLNGGLKGFSGMSH